MSTAVLWGVFVAAGAGTFLLRASFLTFVGDRELPGWLVRALRYVPQAVLSALVLPAIVRPQGSVDAWNVELLAAAVAAAVAWRTRNVLATLGAGMVVFWVVRAVA